MMGIGMGVLCFGFREMVLGDGWMSIHVMIEPSPMVESSEVNCWTVQYSDLVSGSTRYELWNP